MEFNSVLFILYIELILCYKIIEDRKSSEIIKENYIKNLNNSIHSLGHQVEFISKKLSSNEQHGIVETLNTIKDIRKKISDIDTIRISEVNPLNFINFIIGNYFFDYEEKIFIHKSNINKINIDKEKTDTIIMNLITNAIEYLETEKKDIVINIIITKKTKKRLLFNKNFLRFEINHEGIINSGISEKIYEQGFSTKNLKNNNSGIGLFHSRQLAEKMGGKLTHQSKGNKVKFYLDIPIN